MTLLNDEPVVLTTLSACPFCGNEAITFEPDSDRNIVSCRLGHAPMRTIEGWNTRVNPMREQIEALVTDLQGEVVAAQIRAKEFKASRDNVMFVVSDSLAQLYLGIIRRLQAILASSGGVSAEKGVTARD